MTCSQCNDPFFKICDIQYTDMSMTVHPVFSRIFPYFLFVLEDSLHLFVLDFSVIVTFGGNYVRFIIIN